jgi:hypothetical protein
MGNPEITIRFEPSVNNVTVHYTEDCKSLEMVLMMLAGATRAIEEHRQAIKLQNAMRGIQVADSLGPVNGKPAPLRIRNI